MKSPNLNMPYVMPEQAQKHVTVNEAIDTLDQVVQLSAVAAVNKAPEGVIAQGMRYLVMGGATGSWAGKDHRVAIKTEQDWTFLKPATGWQCWQEDIARMRVFHDGVWQDYPAQGVSDLSVAPIKSPADMPGEIIGAIDPYTYALGRASITLVANRVYLSLVRIDRPVEFTGAAMVVKRASSAATGIIRASLHKVEMSAANEITLGAQALDLGTVPATQVGHHTFRPERSKIIEPGWYACAIATQSADVKINYYNWLTPGTAHYLPSSSGASADYKTHGLSVYAYTNVAKSIVESGFDIDWSAQSFVSAQSSQPSGFQFALPVFKLPDGL